MISCKKATELITKREDRSLTQPERFQLQLHLGVCSLCRNYLKQTVMIIKAIKKLTGSEKIVMSEQKKNELRKLLDNEHHEP